MQAAARLHATLSIEPSMLKLGVPAEALADMKGGEAVLGPAWSTHTV